MYTPGINRCDGILACSRTSQLLDEIAPGPNTASAPPRLASASSLISKTTAMSGQRCQPAGTVATATSTPEVLKKSSGCIVLDSIVSNTSSSPSAAAASYGSGSLLVVPRSSRAKTCHNTKYGEQTVTSCRMVWCNLAAGLQYKEMYESCRLQLATATPKIAIVHVYFIFSLFI